MASPQEFVNPDTERERLEAMKRETENAAANEGPAREQTTPPPVRTAASSSTSGASGSTSASRLVKSKIGKTPELQRRHSDGARRSLDMDTAETVDEDPELLPDRPQEPAPAATPQPAQSVAPRSTRRRAGWAKPTPFGRGWTSCWTARCRVSARTSSPR